VKIPLGPKLVLAIQMISLAFLVFWAFVLQRIVDTIPIVIQSAILIGLYTREPVAWVTARWVTALGAAATSILFIYAAVSGATKAGILPLVAFEIVLAWTFFALLGRPDSRAYFHGPRKA
jgi:hypothetical protein